MDASGLARVILELQPGDPIQGSIRVADAEPERFHGWLELVSRLERVHTPARPPRCGETVPDRGETVPDRGETVPEGGEISPR